MVGVTAETTAATTRARVPTPRTIGLVAAGAVAVGVVAAVVDPTHGPVLCPFKFATGLDCPLCGATRAVHSFATGHPARALDHNLLVGIAIPIVIVALVVWLVASVRGRPVRWPTPSRGAWITIAVVVGAFWIVRNLAAFAWLGSA